MLQDIPLSLPTADDNMIGGDGDGGMEEMDDVGEDEDESGGYEVRDARPKIRRKAHQAMSAQEQIEKVSCDWLCPHIRYELLTITTNVDGAAHEADCSIRCCQASRSHSCGQGKGKEAQVGASASCGNGREPRIRSSCSCSA